MAEKKIGKETFKTEPLLAKEAIRLLGKLTKVGGAAWDRLRKDIEDGAEAANAGMVIVTFAVELMRNNDVDAVVDLIEEILSHAQIKSPSGYTRVYMDSDFHGNLKAIPEVVAFVLQENYSDFLSEIGLTGNREPDRKAA